MGKTQELLDSLKEELNATLDSTNQEEVIQEQKVSAVELFQEEIPIAEEIKEEVKPVEPVPEPEPEKVIVKNSVKFIDSIW